jgi:hypothetical protein
MQADRLATYTGWVATHSEYVPTFGNRLGASIEWSKENPEKFSAMVADFDAALDFLNNSGTAVDTDTFANIAAY